MDCVICKDLNDEFMFECHLCRNKFHCACLRVEYRIYTEDNPYTCASCDRKPQDDILKKVLNVNRGKLSTSQESEMNASMLVELEEAQRCNQEF